MLANDQKHITEGQKNERSEGSEQVVEENQAAAESHENPTEKTFDYLI